MNILELFTTIVGSILIIYAIHIINSNPRSKPTNQFAMSINASGLFLDTINAIILLFNLLTTTHLNHFTTLIFTIYGLTLLGEIGFFIRWFKNRKNNN